MVGRTGGLFKIRPRRPIGRMLAVFVLTCSLALAVAGCAETTPTGIKCTNNGSSSCFYYLSGNTTVPCQPSGFNNCPGAPNGSYFAYNGSDGKTYNCTNRFCSFADPIAPPVTCVAHYAYDSLVGQGVAWKVVDQETNKNGTLAPASMTFTSTTASTVDMTASVDLTADADAIFGVVFASVQAHINASVSRTASTIVGNSFTASVPAGAVAHAIYGVNVQLTSGHLHETTACPGKTSNYGTVRTDVPIGVGWCVWIANPDQCPVAP